MNTLHYINECKVSRRLADTPLLECETGVHIFSNASEVAYAGCVFLRTKHNKLVKVQLLLEKCKASHNKKRMQPRLKLMDALIVSRLYNEVVSSGLLFLPMQEI